MPEFVVDKVEELTVQIEKPKVAVMGLTYKGNIDDVRESPAIEIYEMLAKNPRFETVAHDPHVQQDQVPFQLLSLEDALADAHVAVVLADHNEFKTLDSEVVAKQMKSPVVFDTKNCTNLDSDFVTVYKIGDLSGLKPIQL
jgi:UDP-N-acetyl-D-mannosaminuronic acid dehydrogenase